MDNSSTFLFISLLTISLSLVSTVVAINPETRLDTTEGTTHELWDDNNTNSASTSESTAQSTSRIVTPINLGEVPALLGDLPPDNSDENDGDGLCPPWMSCVNDGVMCHQSCVNGECTGGFCYCSEGWTGLRCDVQCPQDCAPLGTCVLITSNQSSCACDDSSTYTPGSGCVSSPGNYGATESPHEQYQLATFRGLPSDQIWLFLVDKYGPLAPLEYRVCMPGFVCAYGNCSRSEASAAECACQTGFTGYFCEIGCDLNCGPNGDCSFNHVNETFECTCHDGYTGFNCTDVWVPLEDPPGIDETTLMLRFAAVLVLLPFFLLVVASIVLYRRGNIPLMKIVYWMKPFEEDDTRSFDAFVSFASAEQDKDFVLQVLLPQLEGRMHFSLYLHDRDFQAGQYISDNIVEAVKLCRRTILVVSLPFVSSGWCKFEYQIALQEMLNGNHRVLPIIIGDLSSVLADIDDTLKSILKTVTWLEYPDKSASRKDFDKFWTRLRLSMPKKRPSPIESGKPRFGRPSYMGHSSLQPSQVN